MEEGETGQGKITHAASMTLSLPSLKRESAKPRVRL
jgi:hypothetical protein